jgi:hypothetical protein
MDLLEEHPAKSNTNTTTVTDGRKTVLGFMWGGVIMINE